MSKQCSKCGEVKKDTEFTASERHSQGIRCVCKVCRRAYTASGKRDILNDTIKLHEKAGFVSLELKQLPKDYPNRLQVAIALAILNNLEYEKMPVGRAKPFFLRYLAEWELSYEIYQDVTTTGTFTYDPETQLIGLSEWGNTKNNPEFAIA